MDRFIDQLMYEGWEHNYSARELPEVEEQLLHFCRGDDSSDDSNAMFIESAAAYLGETLIEEAGGRWDWLFTPKSLDTLEALLRKSFPTVEDYHRAADEPFWGMAAWYVGKYIVENKDAQWQYRGVNPDAPPGTWHAEEGYWSGAVFVNQRVTGPRRGRL